MYITHRLNSRPGASTAAHVIMMCGHGMACLRLVRNVQPGTRAPGGAAGHIHQHDALGCQLVPDLIPARVVLVGARLRALPDGVLNSLLAQLRAHQRPRLELLQHLARLVRLNAWRQSAHPAGTH